MVLFHFRFAPFTGGYVGVDVFFVISGYLITGIVLRDIAAGSFSIAGFYERRIRRIIPALLVMLVLTVAVGAALLTPAKFSTLGRSVMSVALFASNFFFWKQSGYFAPPAEQIPLLHTWTLAVEEQFYIVFPLLLLAIARFGKARFGAWLIMVAAGSFALGIAAMHVDALAAFYLAPPRMWELLIGAIVACEVIPCSADVQVREVLAGGGIVLILASVLAFTPETPFPGYAALLPTIGAGLLLYAGACGPTMVGRLLSCRAPVFIGLISYSLYLLHWPVIVYAEQFAILELTFVQRVTALLATVALSILSWRYVEVPFRSRKRVDTRRMLAFAGTGMTVVCALAGLVYVNDGFPHRFSGEAMNPEPKTDREWRRWGSCAYRPGQAVRELCSVGVHDGAPSFLLWGDSHAQVLVTSLEASAQRHAASGLLANADGCPPLLGIARTGYEWCAGFNDDVLRDIAQRPELRTVILGARWALYAAGRYKSDRRQGVTLVDRQGRGDRAIDNATLFARGLTRTVQQLRALGREVVLIDAVPEVGVDVPSAIAVAARTGRDANRIIAPTRTEYERRNAEVRRTLRALGVLDGVRIISVSDRLCDETVCRVVLAGHALYRDDNHLSTYGARHVSPAFDAVFGAVRVSSGALASPARHD